MLPSVTRVVSALPPALKIGPRKCVEALQESLPPFDVELTREQVL